MTRLQDLDLNLLVVLDALLQDRNVTRASQRMGTTQSTLSSALARLRTALGDPLFVRSQRGLVPTPRALALGPVVREVLQTLSDAMASQEAFDPATAQHRFVLAATDYVQAILLPPLLRLLQAEAPGIQIEIIPISHQFPWESLAGSEVDLILGGSLQGPEGLQSRLLFKDRLACVLRQGHPALERPLDLAAYLSLSHVEVRVVDGQTVADQALAGLNVHRHVVLAVPQFLVALFTALETDLCFTLATRIAHPFAKDLPLVMLPLPFETPPVSVRAFWHVRMKDDLMHRWLRSVVFRASDSLSSCETNLDLTTE
jgi:DNA-binding transcriptional LysR family regulator